MKYHETQEKHDGLSTFIYVYHGLSTFICVFLFFCQKCWCILLCTPLSDASWNSCNGEGKSDETDGFGAVSFMLRPCDVQINDAHSGAVWDCFCEVPCKTWWTHLEASGFSVFHSHLRTWGWRYAKFSNSRATTTSWCPSITGRSPFFGRILILGSCLAAKFYKSTWKYMKIMKPRKFSMNWVWVRFKAKKTRTPMLLMFNRTASDCIQLWGALCCPNHPSSVYLDKKVLVVMSWHGCHVIFFEVTSSILS